MDGFFIVVFLLIGFLSWMASWPMDKSRITEYIENDGGRIVSINWAPFGVGWFGEKNDRIYEVIYYDRSGNQHWATCKTSLFSGVYWTEDRITHRKSTWYDALPPRNEPGHSLIRQIPNAAGEDQAEELRRLREENDRLRKQLGQPEKCPACGAMVASDAVKCPDCEIALR